jgi:4-amino-4-deoxy-L-arabinose transferase-like glycosyltransferase
VSRRTFGWGLAVIALGALAVRLAYILVEKRDFNPGGDAFYYHAGANLLADGKGFILPFGPEHHTPAADHPPLYLMFLSMTSLVGGKSVLTHLVWSSLLGTGTVVLVGVLGRRVAGELVGLVAALIAAISPNMWAPDGMLEAETLGMFLVALAVLLAYWHRDHPAWWRITLVGLTCGLAAMARSELILLLPFLVLPLALTGPGPKVRDRAFGLAAACVAALAVIAPWAAYNQTRFEHPVILSSQFGPLLSSANCDTTYYGAFRGYFSIGCTIAAEKAAGVGPNDDESVRDLANRKEALKYIRAHWKKLPEIESVRLLRIAGLYKPSVYINGDIFAEGRERWVAELALWSFYALALLSIAGAIVVHRARRVPVWPLLAPVGVVIATVLMTYASTRFRTTLEPMLAVLAAAALVAAVRRLRSRPAPVPGSTPDPALATSE